MGKLESTIIVNPVVTYPHGEGIDEIERLENKGVNIPAKITLDNKTYKKTEKAISALADPKGVNKRLHHNTMDRYADLYDSTYTKEDLLKRLKKSAKSYVRSVGKKYALPQNMVDWSGRYYAEQLYEYRQRALAAGITRTEIKNLETSQNFDINKLANNVHQRALSGTAGSITAIDPKILREVNKQADIIQRATGDFRGLLRGEFTINGPNKNTIDQKDISTIDRDSTAEVAKIMSEESIESAKAAQKEREIRKKQAREQKKAQDQTKRTQNKTNIPPNYVKYKKSGALNRVTATKRGGFVGGDAQPLDMSPGGEQNGVRFSGITQSSRGNITIKRKIGATSQNEYWSYDQDQKKYIQKAVANSINYEKHLNNQARLMFDIQQATQELHREQGKENKDVDRVNKLKNKLSALHSSYKEASDSAMEFLRAEEATAKATGRTSDRTIQTHNSDVRKLARSIAAKSGKSYGVSKNVSMLQGSAQELISLISAHGKGSFRNVPGADRIVARFNKQTQAVNTGILNTASNAAYQKIQGDVNSAINSVVEQSCATLQQQINSGKYNAAANARMRDAIKVAHEQGRQLAVMVVSGSVSDLGTELDKIRSGAQSQRTAKPENLNSLTANIQRSLTTNNAMNWKYAAQLRGVQNIITKSGGNLTQDAFTELQSSYHNVQKAVAENNMIGKSFGGAFLDRIKSGSAQFIARYFSLYQVIAWARQAADAIKSVDDQMVELRKVSGASGIEMQDAFERSAAAAKEIGATISDTVSATADWSRLGYNLPDAENLAEVALLYKNIGDNIDINEANTSLISTLQGFQLDADSAESIIDKFNEVSNNYPIDSGGIGEALQRSAASFNAANTDLSESIALITSSNAVVQNPETVGTMWKTVSARIRGRIVPIYGESHSLSKTA